MKHILSNFATKEVQYYNEQCGPTVLPEQVESSDADEFIVVNTMQLMHVPRNSETNKVLAGPTKLTFTLETSDADEFV